VTIQDILTLSNIDLRVVLFHRSQGRKNNAYSIHGRRQREQGGRGLVDRGLIVLFFVFFCYFSVFFPFVLPSWNFFCRRPCIHVALLNKLSAEFEEKLVNYSNILDLLSYNFLFVCVSMLLF